MNERQREQLEVLKRIARERGGWCESRRYVDHRTHLRWRCRHGHVWRATPDSIKRGSWCAACADLRPLGIVKMRELAAKHGGKCTSRRYVNYQTKLRWQCGDCGHRWSATPNTVLGGTWCPRCSPRKRGSLLEMQEIAGERGGLCLSKKYVTGDTKLRWQCAEGHRWHAIPTSIKAGSWCPTCAGATKPALSEIRRTARSRGGELLSDEYVDAATKLRWRCREGHVWEATWNNVRRGTWCRKCKQGGKGKRKPRLTIEDMQAVAESRGGRCVSTDYTNTRTPLVWECAEGHRWEQVQSAVRRGSWCPHCAGVVRGTLDELVELAESRGGLCLASEYRGVEVKVRWRCAEGHEWDAAPKAVKRGTWCPTCGGRQRLTIQDMHELAKERGGRCLSHIYVNNQIHLLWECKRGHQWEAVPMSIRQGTWCPTCFYEDRKRRTRKRRRPRGGKA